jgi:diguanylate cyclase (GGDEF)-like protein/PAS domain S-box-containing protein
MMVAMSFSADSRLAVQIGAIGLLIGTASVLALIRHQQGLAMVLAVGLALLARTFLGVRKSQCGYQRVHEELLVKEARYRDFLDQANDLIQIIAPDGKLLFVNRAWRETLGYTEEETANLSVFDVITPESLGHCQEAFRRIVAGEDVGRIEAQFRSKDGRIIQVEGCTNCRQEAGQPLNTRGIFRDVTERKRAEQALRDSEEKIREALQREKLTARQDTLTKVANRRAFFEIANAERGRACRYGRPLTLAYLDVDNFKGINDRLGHASGDDLLVEVSRILRDNVRASDAVARLGGDEFALLFPETDAAGAEAALCNLQKRLADAMQAADWPVTFSIGAAVFACPESVDEMIRAADEMMYAVKKAGKNNIAVGTARRAAPGRERSLVTLSSA